MLESRTPALSSRNRGFSTISRPRALWRGGRSPLRRRPGAGPRHGGEPRVVTANLDRRNQAIERAGDQCGTRRRGNRGRKRARLGATARGTGSGIRRGQRRRIRRPSNALRCHRSPADSGQTDRKRRSHREQPRRQSTPRHDYLPPDRAQLSARNGTRISAPTRNSVVALTQTRSPLARDENAAPGAAT